MLATEIINRLEKRGYKFYTKSLCKGYLRKGMSYSEMYAGRYGVGYKVHMANCEGSCSNNYHYVYYLLNRV